MMGLPRLAATFKLRDGDCQRDARADPDDVLGCPGPRNDERVSGVHLRCGAGATRRRRHFNGPQEDEDRGDDDVDHG